MTLEYTNRKGDRYYVCEGRTKSGKPKYYTAKKPSGTTIEKLPSEFEIYEHPSTAIVTIRKVVPTRLTLAELEHLKQLVRTWSKIDHFLVDRTGDHFVIYLCDQDPDKVNEILAIMLGSWGKHADKNRQILMSQSTYSPVFRLTLSNDAKRLFTVERYCYLGSIDDWMLLSTSEQTLDELAPTYFKHLGKESFFDLI